MWCASSSAGAETCHPAAALGTFTADPSAVIHAYLFATFGTGFTNFRANPAELVAESRSAQHEIGRGLANLGAVHH